MSERLPSPCPSPLPPVLLLRLMVLGRPKLRPLASHVSVAKPREWAPLRLRQQQLLPPTPFVRSFRLRRPRLLLLSLRRPRPGEDGPRAASSTTRSRGASATGTPTRRAAYAMCSCGSWAVGRRTRSAPRTSREGAGGSPPCRPSSSAFRALGAAPHVAPPLRWRARRRPLAAARCGPLRGCRRGSSTTDTTVRLRTHSAGSPERGRPDARPRSELIVSE
jgi:hypothetical protein